MQDHRSVAGVAHPQRSSRALVLRTTASRVSLLLICLAAAAMALASLLAPDLDLAVARWFFDPATHKFPAAANPLLTLLREQGSVIVIVCLAVIAAAMWVKLMRPNRPLLIRGRAILFLVITLALGPGLLANGILKAQWGRPRPVEVTQFGGKEHYVPWWSNRGTCPSNCSFVSGEAATAAWTLAPAVLVPMPWRPVALGAAALFTLAIGVLRMAFGGHFLTDVVFGALMAAFVVWLVHGLIYRWPRTRLDEQAVDQWSRDFALRLRRLFVTRRRRTGAGHH
jgi:lipid A 4'-phosphatase